MEKQFSARQTPRSMYPSICEQFPSYSNRKCQKPPFSRIAAHIFVCLGDAPATITQYVAWMERQFNACQTPCSIYLSIFNSFRVIRCLSQCVSPKSLFLPHFGFPWGRPWGNHAKCCMDGKRIRCLQIVSRMYPSTFNSFPVIRTASAKKSPFSRTAAHIFVSPEDAPATITQCVTWMERQFNACQTPLSMCLSIFNSFRVIRCVSQCVSPKIAIFYHILVSPGDAHVAITLNVVWMEREFDAYKLSRCMCRSRYNRF